MPRTSIACRLRIFLRSGTLIFTALLTAPQHPAYSQEARLGTNLSAVNDYSPQLPFVDLFRTSRPWLTQCITGTDPGCRSDNAWDTGEAALLDLDGSGWVRSLPTRAAAPVFTSAATFWDVPPQFPRGRYIVTYIGQGTIGYGLGARKDSTRSRTGRDVINIDPANGGILLRITETDPQGSGDYIRNIRIFSESDEAIIESQRFAPAFLERLRPYQALRFMDWMQTNNSVVTSWNTRATPTDARYSTAKGVPAEVLIELANVTSASAWFTMPHQADDTFIRSFAELTKSLLAPALSIYLEYSNEVWNDVFSQGSWVEAQGNAAWPGGSASGFTKRINYYGRRSAEVCEIWRSVFADAPGRVICVTASQAANSWTASEALNCPMWSGGPCVNRGISALAIAPYIGDYIGNEDNASTVSSWSSRSDGGLLPLFRELTDGAVISAGPQGGALSQSFSWIDQNKSVAQQFGLALVAYEGGQHLVGTGSAANNQRITKLFTQANRDERMESLYLNYLQGWSSRGGGVFMHFTDISDYSVYGSWGALEEIGQVSSPKYNALWKYSLGNTPRIEQAILTVRRVGAGKITSSPAGILCGTRLTESFCAKSFSSATRVILTATPTARSRFKGWSGACKHTRRRCIVTVSRQTRVRATFFK